MNEKKMYQEQELRELIQLARSVELRYRRASFPPCEEDDRIAKAEQDLENQIEKYIDNLTIISDNYACFHAELGEAKKTIVSLSQFREDMKTMVSAMHSTARVPVRG